MCEETEKQVFSAPQRVNSGSGYTNSTKEKELDSLYKGSGEAAHKAKSLFLPLKKSKIYKGCILPPYSNG